MRELDTQSPGKRDIGNIFTKPDLDGPIREPDINIPMSQSVEEKPPDNRRTREDIIAKFDEGIAIAETAIREIDKRCAGLEIDVDYEENPELELAMMAVFGEKRDKLTYMDFVSITEELHKRSKHAVAERMGY